MEGKATIRTHQPPTTQHQHHSPPAGAAPPGQNTGGSVRKGQTASADQGSRAQAQKIAQAFKVTWGPPRGMGLLGNMLGLRVTGMGLQFSDFHSGVIRGIPCTTVGNTPIQSRGACLIEAAIRHSGGYAGVVRSQ
eukprot:1142822-Pelagomonas_calceolata.AAC.1